MGAGLNCSKAMIRERAMRELDVGVSEAGRWAERECVPLTTAELCEALLPYFAQADLDFQAVANLFALWRIQLGSVTRQQVVEDQTKVFVDLGPSLVQSFTLVVIQAFDRLFDLLLVLDDCSHHLLQAGLFLLHGVDGRHDCRVDLLLHALEALCYVLEV